MNKDILKGNWKQAKGKIQKTWGKLTDDDLNQVEGNYNELLGKIQERYGISKDEAEKKMNDILK